MTENGFIVALEGLNTLKKLGVIIDYAVGGGIATLRYTEPFFTNDLDIFIILPPTNRKLIDITPVSGFFVSKGHVWYKEHVIIEGTPVQFLVADQLEAEAVRMAPRRKFLGVWTKVFSPEYLVAIMVRVGRPKDRQRLHLLLEQTKINNDVLGDILSRYNLEQKYRESIE
jgi:hypothetical protein